MILTVILILHLCSVVLLILLWKMQLLKIKGAQLFPFLFIPVFGEIVIVYLHAAAEKSGEHFNPQDFMEETIPSNVPGHTFEDPAPSAVPAEDVLMLDSFKQRRGALMNILMENKADQSLKEYIPVIRTALQNDDVEVVHYAAAAMTQMSGAEEQALFEAQAAYAKTPDAEETLNQYIATLQRCIREGMAEGKLLDDWKAQYQKLLEERFSRKPDIADACELCNCSLERGDAQRAGEILATMKQEWPETEQTIQMSVHYYVATMQGKQLQQLLESLQKKSGFSKQTKDMITFWTKSTRQEEG